MENLTEVLGKDTSEVSNTLRKVMQQQLLIEVQENLSKPTALGPATRFIEQGKYSIMGGNTPYNAVDLYDKETVEGHSAVLDITLLGNHLSVSVEAQKEFLQIATTGLGHLMEHLGANVQYVSNGDEQPKIRIVFPPEKDFDTAYASAENAIKSLPEKIDMILRGSGEMFDAACDFVDTVERENIPLSVRKNRGGSIRFTIGDGKGNDAITPRQKEFVDDKWTEYERRRDAAQNGMNEAKR